MNPELKKGDRVVLIRMSDPYTPVPPGTGGEVISSSVVFGDELYYVNWDNGQKLNLISGEDIWMLEDDFKNKRKRRSESVVFTKKQLIESGGPKQQIDAAFSNREIIKNYKVSKLKEFLSAIRATGIINMLQAGPFLTSGSKFLKHFVEYLNVSNKKALKYAIDNADEVRTIMIAGAMKMVENSGDEVTPQTVQRRMNRDISKIMEIYMSFQISDSFDKSEDDYEEDDNDEYEDDNY